MEEKPSKIIYGTNIEHQENHFDIHDNKILGGNFYFTAPDNKGKEKMGKQDVVQPREEAAGEEAEGKLAVEDEEMLLPVFKGSRENLRQFFAEAQGAAPEQIHNKINAWKGDGRMTKKFNIKNLWKILCKLEIYPYNYNTLNKHVMR